MSELGWEGFSASRSDTFDIFFDDCSKFISDNFDIIVKLFVLKPGGTSKLEDEEKRKSIISEFIDKIRSELSKYGG